MTKHKLTKKIVDLLPDDHRLTVEEAMLHWYTNIRNNGGMRLTIHGQNTFKMLGLDSWSVQLNDIKITMSKTMLLELDRKLTYPYFIDYKNKEIVFYSSKEAMMATLYGDIKSWLANYGSR